MIASEDLKPGSAAAMAATLVNGPRQRDYRHPYINGTLIGQMWGQYLGIGPIPPELVMQMLILLKVARGAPRPEEPSFGTIEEAMEHAAKTMKPDTVIDEAGYAECTWKAMRFRAGLECGDGSTPQTDLQL